MSPSRIRVQGRNAFLTLDRGTMLAVFVILVASFLIVSATIHEPGRLFTDNDYPAFYNAGRIINEHARGALFDRALQERLYLDLVPQNAGTTEMRLFSYTPFFALIFAPLAQLPYVPSLALWTLLTLGLFCVGFALTWEASGLATTYRSQAFVIAFAFLPFLVWCLLGAQTSAFGFAVISGAIYLDRKERWTESGLVLSLMLYKPPLLVLLVPMLIVTKRWRSLAAFALGISVLGLVSLAVVGVNGIGAYMEMLATFSRTKATGIRPTGLEVDAFSFFLFLTRNKLLAYSLLLVMLAAVLPLLIRSWKTNPRSAWLTAIAWTLVLNFYVLMYDTTLIIITVVLAVGGMARLAVSFKWLLVVLFLASWLQTTVARRFGVQLMTIALVGLAVYVLRASMRDRERISGSQIILSRFPISS